MSEAVIYYKINNRFYSWKAEREEQHFLPGSGLVWVRPMSSDRIPQDIGFSVKLVRIEKKELK